MQGCDEFSKVGVVGVGLLGSSLLRAMAADDMSVTTVAYDADPDVRRRIRAGGYADVVAERLEDMGDADIVVVCVPSRAVPKVVLALAPHLRQGSVVTDVGSVKAPIVRALVDALPAGFPFVPGHPMAGGERSGPDAGRPDLFDGRPCLLTPLPDTPGWAVDRVEAMWTAVGAACLRVAPETHDRMVAATSHLPHLIAFALMDVLDETLAPAASPGSFIGGGLTGIIRLGQSNPTVWNDIFRLNPGPLLDHLRAFEETLACWRRAIENPEAGDLDRRIAEARRAALGIGSAPPRAADAPRREPEVATAATAPPAARTPAAAPLPAVPLQAAAGH